MFHTSFCTTLSFDKLFCEWESSLHKAPIFFAKHAIDTVTGNKHFAFPDLWDSPPRSRSDQIFHHRQGKPHRWCRPEGQWVPQGNSWMLLGSVAFPPTKNQIPQEFSLSPFHANCTTRWPSFHNQTERQTQKLLKMNYSIPCKLCFLINQASESKLYKGELL